jgi:hypothetical protein
MARAHIPPARRISHGAAPDEPLRAACEAEPCEAERVPRDWADATPVSERALRADRRARRPAPAVPVASSPAEFQ